jgi:triphosphoribosyl-dephospho-CoA synthase
MLPTGLCAQAACILEATARKPGNVHRFLDFDDLGYLDFLLSAAAIAPVLESVSSECSPHAPREGSVTRSVTPALKTVGATILECVQATRQVVKTNTNLGIVLLLAPLSAVPRQQELRSGVEAVLRGLTREDARLAYQAIRLAAPGGLGEVPEEDIRDEPMRTLREVMALAADRDLIARQYVDAFQDVLDDGVPALGQGAERHDCLETTIVHCHLTLMALHPDSLIARKCGLAEAEEASRRARAVLESGWPATAGGASALRELDRWLRQAGHRRNPGTTADLVTASLFVALRDGTITLSCRFSAPGTLLTGMDRVSSPDL